MAGAQQRLKMLARRFPRRCIGMLLLIAALPAIAETGLLNADEKQWLQSLSQPIRVGITEAPPFLLRDRDTGEHRGIAVEFMRYYEARLGVSLLPVYFQTPEDVIEAARRRQVDVVLMGARPPGADGALAYAAPYLSLHNKIVVRRGEPGSGKLTPDRLRGKRVAVTDHGGVGERLARDHPQLLVLPLRDERAVLSAVAFHEADAGVIEIERLRWAIDHEGLSNLAIGGDTPYDTTLAMAVRDDWPLLLAMIDRATLAIGEGERAELVQRWSPDAMRIGEQRERMVAVLVALGAGLGIAVLVLLWNITLRQTVKARTEELEEQVDLLARTQNELEASETRFRQLAELTSDWFWEQDADFRFTRFYGGGLRRFGLDPAPAVGKRRWELPLEGISEAAIAEHRRQVESRHAFRDFTFQLRNARNELRWVTIRGRPIFDVAGTFVGYRGTGHDVTAQMHDQAARAETLERVRALLDGSHAFLALLDAEGTLLDCNRTSLQFCRVYREDVVGRSYSDTPWWSLPQARSELIPALAKARQGNFVRFEVQVADAVGAVHWFEFTLSPIFDAAGAVIHIVPEGRDITDAKQATDALGRMVTDTGAVFGQAYFEKLVELLAGVLEVRFVFVGRLSPEPGSVRTLAMWADGRLARNMDYTLAGTPCEQVVAGAACAYPRGVAGLFPGDALLIEMGIESYIGVVVRGSAGFPIGIVVAMHDVPLVETRNARRLMELFSVRVGTELDRMDFVAAIGELNATLEARVADRTRQLTLANQELEAFSYSVSHDLRAPVRHISGFAGMLAEELGAQLADTPRRHLAIITDSARRMGQLVDDLLDFSRLGRIDLHTVPVNVIEVVDEALRDLAHEMADRDIIWKIGALPCVRADRSLLRQVLLNLLGNAVKYTRPRAPAVIELVAQADREIDGHVVISVCDNGVGIDMKYADKLFGVFQRLHGDTEFEGTGIGLANVKRIVERHGGRVWVSGEPDRGASFHISLPAADGRTRTKNGEGKY